MWRRVNAQVSIASVEIARTGAEFARQAARRPDCAAQLGVGIDLRSARSVGEYDEGVVPVVVVAHEPLLSAGRDVQDLTSAPVDCEAPGAVKGFLKPNELDIWRRRAEGSQIRELARVNGILVVGEDKRKSRRGPRRRRGSGC